MATLAPSQRVERTLDALRSSLVDDETARLRARGANLVQRRPRYPNLTEGAR